MAEIKWDQVGERLFETGVDRGVLYTMTDPGVAWNGLIAVNETPSGGEISSYYLDGVKYSQSSESEEFSGSIEAFTYPDEFSKCDGTDYDENGIGYGMQPREPFNFSYRSLVGNDVSSSDYGYKVHLVYNALARPTTRTNKTLSDSPEADTFNWAFETVPVYVPGRRPTAHLILDSNKIDRYRMNELERLLYGSDIEPPRLPLPEELVATFGWDLFRIIPEINTGLALLSPDGNPDLKGDVPVEGLYTKTVGTRLVASPYEGLYNREDV